MTAKTAEQSGLDHVVFGPVPSRRLGRSLGVNNIPAKHCSYSCVYCQVGKNTSFSSSRSAFYDPDRLVDAVRRRLDAVLSRGEHVDFVAFVSDGEPTLDINLGSEIKALKPLGIPIAVFTNASTLTYPGMVSDLQVADLVSIKQDAFSERTWRLFNRPCKGLKIERIRQGIMDFARVYKGHLISETLIIDGIDYQDELRGISGFLKNVPGLEKAFITTTTRPPQEHWVNSASPGVMMEAFSTFLEDLGPGRVEIMSPYEGDRFSTAGNGEADFLHIIAVHPMRENAARQLLAREGFPPERLSELVSAGIIERKQFQGEVYYLLRSHE